MADFRFVRALNGMTPQTELVTAGGVIEVGDFVIYEDTGVGPARKVIKATNSATRQKIAGLCLGKHQENGVAIAEGDLIQILPVGDSMLIEGVAKDATVPVVGTAVGLDVTSTVQTFEFAEEIKIGRVYAVVDATAKVIQVRVFADASS